MFTSHIATLAAYVQPLAEKYRSDEYAPIIKNIEILMTKAKSTLQKEPMRVQSLVQKESLRILNDKLNVLVGKRKSELDQGITESETKNNLRELKFIVDQFNFLTKISGDIEKLSHSFS